MTCTNPEIGRLLPRYELGALEETEREAFVNHLIRCQDCHDEVYAMAPFMQAFRKGRAAAWPNRAQVAGAGIISTSRPFWLSGPVLLAASLVIAIGAGLLMGYLTQRQSVPRLVKKSEPTPLEMAKAVPPEWAELKVPKAEYVPSGTQGQTRDAEGDGFKNAMRAYEQNDFQSAAEQLRVAVWLEPNHAVAHFYYGVSLLLLEKNSDAIAPLQQAVQLSVAELHESSRYYLALAYLKTNHPREAMAELEAVANMTGPHREAAAQLKQKVAERLR